MADGSEETLPKWSPRTWCELAGAGSFIVSLAVSFGISQYQIGELQKSYAVFEEARRADHDTLLEVKNDVKWIRLAMEKIGKVQP